MPSLKKLHSYIAYFLVGLLFITLIPYNALHSHQEQEHYLYAHSLDKQTHHCEIDELFCETGYDHSCEHGSHIKASHADCFTCEFSFVKFFERSVQTETYIAFSAHEIGLLNVKKKAFLSPEIVSARGPPNPLLNQLF